MKRTLVIAETGVNHNGNVNIAKKMIDIAKECGADIVKFQTFNVEDLVSKHAAMAEYQKKNLGIDKSQKSMLNNVALKKEEFCYLANYCKSIGIHFLSTPFDLDSISFLNPLQKIWKVPSGEITNYPYLLKLAKTKKEVILSTGMSNLKEVDEAIDIFKENGGNKITILHCTTEYPTPIQDVNLRAMLTLKDHCGCDVGYSDHTLGIEVPIAAVAMGAAVIEKHFTLDRNMEGPDHKASLIPDEFAMMVKCIRNVEKALGNSEKLPSDSEKKNINIIRKSIVASRDIKLGEILSEKNITTKRPGNGINPMKWKEVVGTRAVRNFKEDELIEL